MGGLEKTGSSEIHSHTPTYNSPSKLKTYGFAIAIIIGIGGLAAGAVGLAGYFHVGALSTMAQVDAIIMMGVGGGGGAILLIIGGILKNRQRNSSQQHGAIRPALKISSTPTLASTDINPPTSAQKPQSPSIPMTPSSPNASTSQIPPSTSDQKLDELNSLVNDSGIPMYEFWTPEDAASQFEIIQTVLVKIPAESSLIMIPEPFLKGKFIQEKILFRERDVFSNMGIYLLDPSQFDHAVSELIIILSKFSIGELGGALSLLEDGRIGINTLTECEPNPNPEDFIDLVNFFPYHADLIKQKMNELNIAIDETSIEEARAKGIKYLKRAYIEHFEWLKEKGITLESSRKIFDVAELSMLMTPLVEQELLRINAEGNRAIFEKRSWGEYTHPGIDFFINPESAQAFAPIICWMALQAVHDSITKSQERESGLHEIKQDSDLIRMRSPILEWKEHLLPALHAIITLFDSSDKTQINHTFDYSSMVLTAEELIEFVLEKLVDIEVFFMINLNYNDYKNDPQKRQISIRY